MLDERPILTPFGGQENVTLDCCDETLVHRELVEQVYAKMPDQERLDDLADLFKVFGDTTRIKILYVLLEKEMCTCDLAEVLGMTQSAVSHQLKVLKISRLIKSRREGKSVWYALADDHVHTMIAQGMEHVNE